MNHRTYLAGLCHLSAPARRIFCLGLGLCCWMLLCAFLLLLRSLPLDIASYRGYIMAAQLERATLAVFFSTAFLGSFVEEQMLKQSGQ